MRIFEELTGGREMGGWVPWSALRRSMALVAAPGFEPGTLRV